MAGRAKGWAGVAAALTLFVAACSGSGESDDGGLSSLERRYAEAFALDMVDADGGFSVEADEAACMSEAILLELGAEPFEAAGVEPADIEGSTGTPGALLGSGTVSDEQAAAISAAWGGCVDFEAAFSASFADGMALDDAASTCVVEALRADGFRDEFVRVSFTTADPGPGDDVGRQVIAVVNRCAGDDAPIVQALADSFAAEGLDDVQSRCVAQGVLAAIGIDRLLEMTASSGELAGAPAELQLEITQAVLAANAQCGIPLALQAGG